MLSFLARQEKLKPIRYQVSNIVNIPQYGDVYRKELNNEFSKIMEECKEQGDFSVALEAFMDPAVRAHLYEPQVNSFLQHLSHQRMQQPYVLSEDSFGKLARIFSADADLVQKLNARTHEWLGSAFGQFQFASGSPSTEHLRESPSVSPAPPRRPTPPLTSRPLPDPPHITRMRSTPSVPPPELGFSPPLPPLPQPAPPSPSPSPPPSPPFLASSPLGGSPSSNVYANSRSPTPSDLRAGTPTPRSVTPRPAPSRSRSPSPVPSQPDTPPTPNALPKPIPGAPLTKSGISQGYEK